MRSKLETCLKCNGTGIIEWEYCGLPMSVHCYDCKGHGKVEVKHVDETKETVQHPLHYNEGKYEVIDVIEDWKLGFNDGNAVKYIGRHRHKGHPVEDLKKALWYIARELVIAHSVPADELAQAIRTVVKTKN